MRRFLPLLIGCSLFLPQTVSAEALSAWVQRVLDRTDQALSLAEGLPGSDPVPTVIDQIKNNLSVVRDAKSAVWDFALEGEFLKERTICFQSDRFLFLDKIHTVEDALTTAIQADKTASASRLLDIYTFLLEAYRSFLRGSIDPSFADSRLRFTYSFELPLGDASAPDREEETDSDEPLCPYTTDYGPHSIAYIPLANGEGSVEGSSLFDVKSYGCDRDKVQQILDHLPDPIPSDASEETRAQIDAIHAEASDLIDFLDTSNALASDLYTLVRDALFNIESTIAIITGKPAPTASEDPVAAPSHDAREGCLRPPAPDSSRGDSGDIESILASFPDYFDAKNLHMDPLTLSLTFDPPSDLTLPIGVLFRSTDDFFSVMPSAQGLSRSFSERKGTTGFDRPFERALTDHPQNDLMISWIWRWIQRGVLGSVSAGIDRETSFIESISRDAYERTLEAVRPLENAAQALSDVTTEELPKKYIPSLVYFLRRSCIDGHCRETLDAVGKRIFNPYCHPYVSGLYANNRVAEKCFCQPKDDDHQDGLDLAGCDVNEDDPNSGNEDCQFFKKFCSEHFNADDYRSLDEQEGAPILCGETSSASSE